MATGTATARRRKIRRRGRGILSVIVVFFTLAALAAAYLSIFCFHYYTVTSNSMSPTLMGNLDLRDRVLCWLRSFPGRAPRRWEIVIFHTPGKENLDLLASGGEFSISHDMTIKRIISPGGETIALRDGDVWARRGGQFVRQIKPRGVQDTLWIPVHEASFPAVRADEFAHYWRSRHGEAVDAADSLALPPGAEFFFRPMIRTGTVGREMRDLPGVPDRYLLPQNLTYLCAGCGATFTRWFAGGQAQERCPACGVTAYEESVRVYSHDSGLTSVGEDAVTGIPAGDAKRYRVYPYHIVGDLRLAVEAMLPAAQSSLELRLEKDGGVDSVVLSAAARPEIAAGEWFRAEFARVDGELRLTIDGEAVEAAAVSSAGRDVSSSDVSGGGVSSGVSFAVGSGGALLRRLSVGRDVHYFSGVGNPFMPQFSAMSAESEIALPEKEFFVLGDNTDVSLDSRAWGALPYGLLAGSAVWWDAGEHLPGARFGEDAPERGRN